MTSVSMTVGLRVTDVQAALDFYQGIGFTPVLVTPDDKGKPVFCAMNWGQTFIVFDAVETPMPMPDSPRERAMKQGPRGLGVKVGMSVPDIEPIYRNFVASRCQITCEPMEEFWCERLFTAIDPFGYEWQFTQGAKSMTMEENVAAAKSKWQI